VSTPFEHVSVMKTLVTRFGIPAVNERVTASNDLSSCIDPTTLRDPQPPVVLPQMSLSLSALRARPRPARIEHPEMWRAAERGYIPRHLDRRRDGDAIARRVLEQAARLGVVRLRA
jgi:phospholipase C